MRIGQFACSGMTMICLNEVSISDDMKNSKMIIFTVFGRLPYFCATSHRNHSVDYDRDLARSLN
jgi:hypothetical protein